MRLMITRIFRIFRNMTVLEFRTIEIRIKKIEGSILEEEIQFNGRILTYSILNKNYFPFGMEMPNFGYKAEEYRYGFNGMEKDNEIKGKGTFI